MSDTRTRSYQHNRSDGMPKGTNPGIVVRALYEHKVRTLLDVGGGRGEFMLYCRERKSDLTCWLVDVSTQAVASANRSGVYGWACDAGEDILPYESAFFDAVHCGDTLEHIYATDALLDEIHRVLRPGGVFIVTVPNLAAWFNRLMLLVGVQPMYTQVCERTPGPRTGSHIRVMTTGALKWLLEQHGFAVKSMHGVGFCLGWGASKRYPVLTRLLSWLTCWNPYWANRVTVVAMKEQA